MTLDRRSFNRNIAATLGLGLVGQAARAESREGPEECGMSSGKIFTCTFTCTNNAAGNIVLAFGNGAGGTLTLLASYPTGGLGSQSAVTLSSDGRNLFVVNAGSNSLSTFAVLAGGLTLVSVHDAGGLHPISVSERDGLVCAE